MISLFLKASDNFPHVCVQLVTVGISGCECDVPQKLNSEDISYEIRRRTASPEEDGKEMRDLGSLEQCCCFFYPAYQALL